MSQSQKLKLLIHGYEIRVRGHKKEIETYGADSVVGAFACLDRRSGYLFVHRTTKVIINNNF